METVNPGSNMPSLKQDRQMLMIMHLSQLLNLVTAIGGIVVPLILWQLKKDEIKDMDAQGKEVTNFQISLFVYYVIGLATIFFLVGFFILGIVAIINIVFPIIYGLKAKDGARTIKYPLTISFFK